MAELYDDDKALDTKPKSNKAWLILGAGLLAAAGFGWQYLSNSGQSLGSLVSGGGQTENRDAAPTSRPLSSGKISTGTNGTDTTAPAVAVAANTPASNGTASTPNGKEASGSLKMTDLSTPSVAPVAAAKDASSTATAIEKLEKKLADKKATLAAAAGKVAQADTAPVAAQGSTPPLKMDKEFRSLLYAVFYRWASAEMGPNARATVAKLVPEALKGVKIVLTGRTDSTGDPGLNKILAERRADSIRKAFVRKGVNAGIIESNINTSGDDKLNEGTVTPLLPKAGNNRARRVDIYIEAKDGNGGGMKPKK
ncbi:MAG: OmpA family protein [Burkholderiales bacterium]